MLWPESQKCLTIHSSSKAEQRWEFENEKYIRDGSHTDAAMRAAHCRVHNGLANFDGRNFFRSNCKKKLFLLDSHFTGVDFKLYFYLFFSHRCWKDSVTFRNSLKSFRYLCKLLLAAAVCAPTKYSFQYLFLFWTHLSRLKCIQKQMIYIIEKKTHRICSNMTSRIKKTVLMFIQKLHS